MRNSFYILLSVFFFNSCAYHSGVMTGNASLTDGNFQVVKLAVGHARVSHFLGIGGLKTDAIVFEAKQDLLRNYPLKRGQVLANVTVDFKRSYFILVDITKVTLTADVIDFTPINNNLKFDEINTLNLHPMDLKPVNFSLGDSVIVLREGKPRRALIVGFDENRVESLFKGMDEKFYTRFFELKMVLKMKPNPDNIELYGFDVDERVKFTTSKGETKEGVIFGINSFQVGVKYNFKEDGSFNWVVVDFDKVEKLLE